jgi:hypothetical protein
MAHFQFYREKIKIKKIELHAMMLLFILRTDRTTWKMNHVSITQSNTTKYY